MRRQELHDRGYRNRAAALRQTPLGRPGQLADITPIAVFWASYDTCGGRFAKVHPARISARGFCECRNEDRHQLIAAALHFRPPR